MSSFTKPLVLKFLDKKKNNKCWFELVEPFEYHVHSLNSGDVITVPEGYCTDFASVPRIFWSIIPPIGLYGKAAVIHDYLCDEQTRTRKEADLIFREAMSVLKVSPLQIFSMYYAVRSWAILLSVKQQLSYLSERSNSLITQPFSTIATETRAENCSAETTSNSTEGSVLAVAISGKGIEL